MSKVLNLFYQEPNPDRWIKYDRYPRQVIRRIIRGKYRPGGVMMVALELMKGLDKLKIPYRFNDFKYAKKHPNELIGVIGKPQLIYAGRFKNPILFGAGIFSHPVDCPDLFEKYPNVKKVLVPGDWMKTMFEPYYGNKVISWPVGIDTDKWNPNIKNEQLPTDFLVYNKILWDRVEKEQSVLYPILKELKEKGFNFETIKYGNYTHKELLQKLSNCKAVIFLGEHETQGLAYQQILATNTPMLAWDKGGFWLDPSYYPERVKFEPVSSVPYWDNRCGLKFKSTEDFPKTLATFIQKLKHKEFAPEKFISENLSLTGCATEYVKIYEQCTNELLND